MSSRKLHSLSTLLIVFFLWVSMGTVFSTPVGPNGGEKKIQSQELNEQGSAVESDSTKTIEPVEKKSEKNDEDEEESVSILSINIIFEILYRFNFRDIFEIPGK